MRNLLMIGVTGAAIIILLLTSPTRYSAKQLPPGTEVKMGTAAFQVRKVDGETVIQPMIAPTFKVHKFDGPDVDGIQPCSVWSKVIAEEQDHGVVVTLIRCGVSPSSTTYAIEEVDFVYDKEGKR